MNTIVTYFQQSEKFQALHVERMKAMCERYCLIPFQFLCLTSSSIPGISCLPPLVNLPGWWGKISLFSHPEIVSFDNILYFDLDTIIVGRVDNLLDDRYWKGVRRRPIFLEDFYEKGKIATGIMAWEKDQMKEIAEKFFKNSAWIMRNFRGDQEFIRYLGKGNGFFIQDFLPGIYSYKVDCEKGLPEDSTVVSFHGRPFIQDVKDDWVIKRWR